MLKLWGSSFFSKCSKSYVDSKNAIKYEEKVFGSQDKFFWIDCKKFPLMWGE